MYETKGVIREDFLGLFYNNCPKLKTDVHQHAKCVNCDIKHTKIHVDCDK